MGKDASKKTLHPEIGMYIACMTYVSFSILISIGHIRDFLAKITGLTRYQETKTKPGFSELFKSWESFFTRRLYHRVQDCWNRPIASGPGAFIDVMERDSKDGNCTLFTTGKLLHCHNVGSYNYLGFGSDDWKETCGKEVLGTVAKWPISMCASQTELGHNALLDELETLVAQFVGHEAACIYTMGYGTNLTSLPVLTGPETLIISDALNHTSIVNGSRASEALVRVFQHNSAANLEQVLREAITYGQPKHRRPWKKILVVVEGIYSMEGTICNLPEILAVCKKYKAYIYVDEAHSIGALGDTGRGVCQYWGVNPRDIDILMGTFTKSFGGMGGYVAGSRALINEVKNSSSGIVYHNAMSPVVCQQVITCLKHMMNNDPNCTGQRRISQLRENSNYFRSELVRIGVHVYGDFDSPIIPMMIYCPAKVSAFSRECLKRNVAVVVVGFPATSVVLSRARFCISASHTKEDLVKIINVIEEVAELVCLKYNKNFLGAESF